jgi:hypothetical protein
MVSKMLMKKSALHPRSRKTPRGGRKIARMILQRSEAVRGIVIFVCNSQDGLSEVKL